VFLDPPYKVAYNYLATKVYPKDQLSNKLYTYFKESLFVELLLKRRFCHCQICHLSC